MRRPDFFIVGAPKCGTTALYRYLQEHPQIFMPERKEPHHFGSDLEFRDQRPPDLEAYLALFEAARPDQRAGEASVFYLRSERAATEIHAFRPDARILTMLRDPVEMLHSFHSQRVFNGTEDLAFAAALEAEPARRRGERLPPRLGLVQGLQYRELAAFADQLQRYLDVFGRDQIWIALYDDFRTDTAGTVRAACRFIGVEPRVPDSLPVVNANKEARSEWLRNLLWSRPQGLRRAVHALVPSQARRRRLSQRLRRWNTRAAPREPLDPDLRERLRKELAPQVERLAILIDRDLSAWLPG
jgi:hypothetical protein